MSEALTQMVGEVHERADVARGYVRIDPPTSTDIILSSKSTDINQNLPDKSNPPDFSLLSSPFRARNFSTGSVQSNLFTHSWRRPATYTIPDLSSYIASTPLTRITRLKWCKNRRGVKHEFLLLKVERPEDGSTLWLRLERRIHENASVLKSISSPVPSGDTAKICNDVSRLFDASRSPVQVETEFTVPLLLQRLGNLLSVLKENSPHYKLPSENCYFFCAVIYESLFSMGKGMNVAGAPSKFSLSRGAEVKEKIKKCMDTWSTPETPPSIPSLELLNPLPTEWPASPTSLSFERLPNQVSDPHIEQDPSAYSEVSAENRPFNLTGLRAEEPSHNIENATRIPIALITVPQPELKATQANTPQPYPHDSGDEKNKKRSTTSLVNRTDGEDTWARASQPQSVRSGRSGRTKSLPSSGPDIDTVTSMPLPRISAPSRMLRKLPQPQEIKLYVSVDFGATHSGVSYATSTNGKAIPIVSWPGSSDPLRKIPTCLVYVSLGDVRAWGLEAKDINLRRGWIRCEWFKLWLDPESAPSTITPSLPIGKLPADVVADFLSSLWMYAKERILFNYTLDTLNFADIYLTVPASWDAHSSLLLREVAVKAGLVVQVSHKDVYWQERLHIIPETEASAIHSVPLTKFLPDQNFVICDAGGSTVDIATYTIQRAWGTPEIAEVCLRSGSYCGSLFLDIHFCELVRARLADHPSHLDEASLTHFLLTFSGSEKLGYKGSADDAKMFRFRCSHLQDSNDPSVGLEHGELIISGHVLRHEVFDPVIHQVIRTIHSHMRSSRIHVDALLLVGGFSTNEYLFQRIKDEFKSAIPSIIRPIDGNTASIRGAARSGLYPTVTSVIPSQSVVMRVRLPAESEDKRMRPAYITTSGGTQFCENRLLYIIKKGVSVHKGSRVDVEMRKFSVVPSDSIFETLIYTSSVDRTLRYTDQGETKELCLCRADLKELPSFKEQAMVATREGFYTDFELGFEMGTDEIRGELLYKEKKFGSVMFDLRS